MKRNIVLYLAAFFLLFTTTFLFAKDAPDFTFKSIDGKEISLSDYKGKVIIVNFWATWCGPCIHEMPSLEKLSQNYKEKGLQVLGLTVQSNANLIPKKITQTGVKYPVLLNAEKAVGLFGYFNTLPQTFIINREGKIVAQIEGARSYEQFEKEIKPLL